MTARFRSRQPIGELVVGLELRKALRIGIDFF
jgi:hypothetical protein